MKKVYLLYSGEYEDRDVVRIFETREQAELYANVYGYDTDDDADIEEANILYTKDDTFPTKDIWWKVHTGIPEIFDNNMTPSIDVVYNWQEKEMHEDLSIIDSYIEGEKIITFNVMADNKQQAVIKANKRCEELRDYLKNLLEKK